MVSLKVKSWHSLVGRGLVAIVDIPLKGAQVKKGELVDLDGTVYQIKGIECTSYFDEREEEVGLVVHPFKEE